MKNILSLLCFYALFIQQLIAQCDYNKSTNTISVWDWKQEPYTDMFVIGEPNIPYYSLPGAIPGSGVPSPFIPPSGGSTNTNLQKFYNQYAQSNSMATVDCDPNDGWELLAKEFGTALVPTNTPFFALYNRYTGTATFSIPSGFSTSKISVSATGGYPNTTATTIFDINSSNGNFCMLSGLGTTPIIYFAPTINAPQSGCSSTIVSSGKNVTFVGHSSVTLNPGFEVQLGATFSAF